VTTIATLATRTLRRLGIIDALTDASAEDMAATVEALNELLDSWAAMSIDTKFREVFTSGFASTDTFWLFVPPADCDWATIEAMAYQGTWDATANSPSLASGSGTQGYFYRVDTAGTTSLDDLATWAVDDALIFGKRNRGFLTNNEAILGSDSVWLKARSSRSLEGAVIANLAMRIVEEYGGTPSALLANDARRGFAAIASAYVVPGVPNYDAGIVLTSGRWIGRLI